ncbi:MAG: HAD-IA family hydrolase [Novosphingobium sp.]|nr:HAD-IA family hydrolase [Novosphingobium sp.]
MTRPIHPLAVFDCDGTLIDGQASICEAMEAGFARFDLALPERNDIRRAVGLSLPQAVRRLLPEADPELQSGIVDGYKRAFRDARSNGQIVQPLFDGMAELLAALAADGWQLGVATGMSDRGLTHCLAEHALTERFVTLQTADRHPSKPHPAMLEMALFEAGAQPEDAVMIGDTAYDMEMAVAANVRAVGVSWGYHAPAELTEAGAEFVAATPADLKDYLLS